MKHTILALSLFAALAAHATDAPKPPKHAGGYVKTPQQVSATVSPSSASSATAAPSTSAAYSSPTISTPVSVLNAPSTTLNAGSPTTTVSNSTTVDGAQRSAPPVFVPAGAMPSTSCRLFIGLGGSNTSGSLGGGVPIGNDGVCLAATQIALMDKLGGFSRADYLLAACRVEGMADTSVCKVQAERKAEGTGLAVVAGTSHTGEQ